MRAFLLAALFLSACGPAGIRTMADITRAQVGASQIAEGWDAAKELKLREDALSGKRPKADVRKDVAAHRAEADKLHGVLGELAGVTRAAGDLVLNGKTIATALLLVAPVAARVVLLFIACGIPVPEELSALAGMVKGGS